MIVTYCPWCNGQLVEVDNPMRPEVRHKRGQECSGPPSAEEQARRDEAWARFADALIVLPPGHPGPIPTIRSQR
jgi:hypothetical protein